MKVKNRPRSSSLFLMELILAILFFSVASAVCVQIFVKSHLISRQSEELSQAVTLCTNSAEIFAASDDPVSGTTHTYYDEEFALCKQTKASYVQTIHIYTDKTQGDGDLICADISLDTITNSDDHTQKAIYTLHTARHLARRTGYEEN